LRLAGPPEALEGLFMRPCYASSSPCQSEFF
jgi:hypothetical protein